MFSEVEKNSIKKIQFHWGQKKQPSEEILSKNYVLREVM